MAPSAGFCWGVRRAVEKARGARKEAGQPVYTDGPLIHNEQMLAELEAEGIRQTNDLRGLDSATVIIRAHGVTPGKRERLRQAAGRVVDATCGDVARIQGLIRKHAREGCYTLIFGDPGHAEVEGLLGFTEGRGRCVTSPKDMARVRTRRRVCLVAQSTQFPDDFAEIAAAVRRWFPDAIVLDTICGATKSRQKDVLRLAPKVDAFVVVGGRHSANTLRLAELAARYKPTYHVETADQLDLSQLAGCRVVGLTAGASTPDFILQEVRRVLEAIPSKPEQVRAGARSGRAPTKGSDNRAAGTRGRGLGRSARPMSRTTPRRSSNRPGSRLASRA